MELDPIIFYNFNFWKTIHAYYLILFYLALLLALSQKKGSLCHILKKNPTVASSNAVEQEPPMGVINIFCVHNSKHLSPTVDLCLLFKQLQQMVDTWREYIISLAI